MDMNIQMCQRRRQQIYMTRKRKEDEKNEVSKRNENSKSTYGYN